MEVQSDAGEGGYHLYEKHSNICLELSSSDADKQRWRREAMEVKSDAREEGYRLREEHRAGAPSLQRHPGT
eukprot:scaffold125634_cov18-Tisochrysis_lutea.AAC.1